MRKLRFANVRKVVSWALLNAYIYIYMRINVLLLFVAFLKNARTGVLEYGLTQRPFDGGICVLKRRDCRKSNKFTCSDVLSSLSALESTSSVCLSKRTFVLTLVQIVPFFSFHTYICFFFLLLLLRSIRCSFFRSLLLVAVSVTCFVWVCELRRSRRSVLVCHRC